MIVACALDDEAARHLERALDEHRRWCRANGRPVPTALAQLALLARSGPGRPTLDTGDDFLHDGPMSPTPILLEFAEVARLLGTSERTIRRLTASGELAAVVVGGRRRVHAADVAAYADALRRPDVLLAAALAPGAIETRG